MTVEQSFDAFVLQPLGGNQYKVVYENSFSVTALASPGIETFPVATIAVQPGDLIAHYGSGIPFTDSPTDTVGGSFQAIYYSTPSAPSVGDVITLPALAFLRVPPPTTTFTSVTTRSPPTSPCPSRRAWSCSVWHVAG